MDEKTIGVAEMRVLKHVAAHGPQTVRQVWEAIGEPANLVRTTVLQMMERLRKKGMLTRKAGPAGWMYEAAEEPSDLEQATVARFVRDTLGGSVSPFVHYLSGTRDLTQEDVAELRKLIDELEGTK